MGQFFLQMSQAGFQCPRTEIRNGLFIFKYTGPHSEEVSAIEFLEGSSNLGDAFELDQSEEEQQSFVSVELLTGRFKPEAT